MSIQGADPAGLEAVAVTADRLAHRLRSIIPSLAAIRATARWSGNDAVRYDSTWEGAVVPFGVTAASTVERLAEELRRQASEQVAASSIALSASSIAPGAGSIAQGAASSAAASNSAAGSATAGSATQTSADPSVSPTYVPVVGVDPQRQFLMWDPSGDGRAIEVFGDLTTAQRIGIWLPGVGTTINAFSDPASLAAYRIWAGDERLAVIEWLGYDPPDTVAHAAAEMGSMAKTAAADLNRFIDSLRATLAEGDGHTIILGGHSYGATVVANAAASGTSADVLVLAGAPGVPVDAVNRLTLKGHPGSSQSVFVAANRFDPVRAGALIDDVVDGAVHAAIRSVLLPPFGLSPLLGIADVVGLHPGPHTLWSTMHTDPTSVTFGATRVDTGHTTIGDVTRANGPADLARTLSEQHRYTFEGSVSLESIRDIYRTSGPLPLG